MESKSKLSAVTIARDKEEVSTKEQSSSPPDDISRIAKLEEIKKSMKERRVKKFDGALGKHTLNLEELRSLAWNGIPSSKSYQKSTCQMNLVIGANFGESYLIMFLSTRRCKPRQLPGRGRNITTWLFITSAQTLLQQLKVPSQICRLQKRKQ